MQDETFGPVGDQDHLRVGHFPKKSIRKQREASEDSLSFSMMGVRGRVLTVEEDETQRGLREQAEMYATWYQEDFPKLK